MKSNELRIGNFVKHPHDGSINVVEFLAPTEIGMVITKSYMPYFTAEQAEPIPLTEEWLIKFGAQLDEEDDSFVFTESGFYVSVNDKNEALFFFKNEELCEFNYVHQLQNLYFALTGEELTYEDSKP